LFITNSIYNSAMPILDARTLEFFSRSPEQTRRLGVRLGGLLQPGDLVCLSGDLGAGKTTLVQGLAQGWGSLDQVSSPTFVLVNTYRRPDKRSLYHLDAYRLANAFEAEELDLDIMLETGPLVVEWPERIKSVLPAECLWLSLRWVADEHRGMVFHSQGTRYEEILAEFRKRVFGG
jgi:tRNA threonylcarbamoyladenosine biosynthesis protein TsaE